MAVFNRAIHDSVSKNGLQKSSSAPPVFRISLYDTKLPYLRCVRIEKNRSGRDTHRVTEYFTVSSYESLSRTSRRTVSRERVNNQEMHSDRVTPDTSCLCLEYNGIRSGLTWHSGCRMTGNPHLGWRQEWRAAACSM